MDFIKNAADNLKSIGFGAAVPGLRDKLLGMINPDEAAKEEEIRRIAQEEAAKGKAPAAAQAMKKGGAVKSKSKPKASSASKRADGIAVKGKTKGRYI